MVASPKLEIVGACSFNFGKYPAKETKTATFTIKNSGDQVLKVKSIRKTCGCFKPSVEKKELKANESTKIKVAVEAYGIYKSFSKFVFVTTNEPKSSITKLRISGNSEPVATIYPQDKIHLGTVSKDQSLIKEFVIKPYGKNKLKLGEIKVNSTHGVKTTLAEEKENYKLTVEYDKNRKLGRIKTTIRIPVVEPKGWRDLEIVLYGRVK